jgi:hypothetical protein
VLESASRHITLRLSRAQEPQRGRSGATVLVGKGSWSVSSPWTSWACQGVRGFSRALTAERRVARALLRHRLPLLRPRAAFRPHVPQTNRQDHRPAVGGAGLAGASWCVTRGCPSQPTTGVGWGGGRKKYQSLAGDGEQPLRLKRGRSASCEERGCELLRANEGESHAHCADHRPACSW